MDNAYSDLKKIIRSYLKKERLDSIYSDTKKLYNMSNSLNISCIVGYTLEKNDLYSSLFNNCIYKSLAKYTLYNNYKNKIKEIYDEENIKYIFLKGESIARYYDEPYLRFSSDLDIVIDKNDYEKALYLIINKLSFINKKNSVSEKTLVNKDGVNIDFHHSLRFDSPCLEKMFEHCFENNELDDNYKYVYFLEHSAKHFASGQLDLRFFIDLFYLRNKIDEEKVKKLLKELSLCDFNDKLNSYLDYILLLHNPSDTDLKIEEFIISYANDQGASNRVNNHKNKVGFIFRHVFPKYETMVALFPNLKDRPFLLPWYYLLRVFRALRSKRRKYIKEELKATFDNRKIDLINELGITSYNK